MQMQESQNPSNGKVAEQEFYKRIKLLGEGAYGKAYLVECLQDHKLWVIKQMSLNTMTDAERRETLKEAKILQGFQHPNIVKFKEVYKTKKGKLCIVMEYADGGDLSMKIQKQKESKKHFEESLILDWFTQICLALKHVHDRKVIHRDLKGQNVFLTQSNRIKLGDFGIARVLSKTLEKAKTFVGTPYYLSPEIIEQRPYSFKSDIWSLGVMLYELCALKPPFNGQSLHFLSLNIVRGKFDPIPTFYSNELKNLIKDMLNINPDKRPNVHDILKSNIITKRIRQFLSETQKNQEFEHTVLHNQKIFNFGNDNNEDQQQQISHPKQTNEGPRDPKDSRESRDKKEKRSESKERSRENSRGDSKEKGYDKPKQQNVQHHQPQQLQQHQQHQQHLQQQQQHQQQSQQQYQQQQQQPHQNHFNNRDNLNKLPRLKTPPNFQVKELIQNNQGKQRQPEQVVGNLQTPQQKKQLKPLAENKGKVDIYLNKPQTPGPNMLRQIQTPGQQVNQQILQQAFDQYQGKQNNEDYQLQNGEYENHSQVQQLNALGRMQTPKENQLNNGFQKNKYNNMNALEFRRQPSAPQVFQKNNGLIPKEELEIYNEAQRKINEYKRESNERRRRLESAERAKVMNLDRNRINSVDKKFQNQEVKYPVINQKPSLESELLLNNLKQKEQERLKKKASREYERNKILEEIGERDQDQLLPAPQKLNSGEKQKIFSNEERSTKQSILENLSHNHSELNDVFQKHEESQDTEVSTVGSNQLRQVNGQKVDLDVKRGAIPTPLSKKKIVVRTPVHSNNSQLVRNGLNNKPNLANKRFSQQGDDLGQLEQLGAKKYNSQDKVQQVRSPQQQQQQQQQPNESQVQKKQDPIAKPKIKRIINNQSDLVGNKFVSRVQSEPGKFRIEKKKFNPSQESPQNELSSQKADLEENPSQVNKMAEKMVEMQNLIDSANKAVSNMPQFDKFDSQKDYFQSPLIQGQKKPTSHRIYSGNQRQAVKKNPVSSQQQVQQQQHEMEEQQYQEDQYNQDEFEDVDREDDEEEPDNETLLDKQLSMIHQTSEEEQETMKYIDHDDNKLKSLRIFLEDILGKENFSKAYKIIQREISKFNDITELDDLHKGNNYATLLPFLTTDLIQKSIKLLLTLVSKEEQRMQMNLEK